MSTEQITTTNNNIKRPPVEVIDWNELIRYTQFLCRDATKKYKICMIDEEQEEIRIENKEEFETNLKYAQDHGLKSLSLIVYIDDIRTFDGIYHIEKSPKESLTIFPIDKLQNLRENVLADRWYIPVKLDESLGICLTSAIKLAQEGKLDTNTDGKEFIEKIVPEAFRKLLTTQSVYSWPREIQCGIFDIIELFIDLVGTRLRYPPVPVTLLNTLAIIFDIDTTYSQKHKGEPLPTNRSYKLDDEELLKKITNDQKDSYGWIRSFFQRFMAQNGIKNLRGQFEYISNSNGTLMEYNCLLQLISKCHKYIEPRRFRLLFTRPIRSAIQYYRQMKKNKTESNESLNQLNETLIEICFNYEMNDEVNEILELPSVPNNTETPSIVPSEKPTVNKKSKSQDCYEQLAEEIRSLTMNNADTERKNIKKQRTDEQITIPIFTRHNVTDCTTDDLLSSSEKRSLKRKHRREQQRHIKKENKRANPRSPTTPKTYDRSDPADILRFFAPMKIKISGLYDDLQTATCYGNLHEVLKIQEKLKLLRPYSARFIADENTPDGTPMQPGQIFRKSWILLNDGSMPWNNDDIQLINLFDGIKVLKQPIIPVIAPHDRAIISVDYICENQPGIYESKWILSYRNQTFGPMIWCSIEVGQKSSIKEIESTVKETFEFIDIPLPACFDLTKPYQSTSDTNSLQSSFILPNSTQLEDLCSTDNDSLSSSLPILNKQNETSLIDLTPINEDKQKTPELNQSTDFVDSVVTNLFSVAKQAGSTAKAIFNTLQANEEVIPSAPQPEQQPILINTANSNVDDFFEHIEDNEHPIFSNDPMEILIEMGFVNRSKNQKLLVENNNDLNKVVELLTIEDCD